ncbi:MAG: hypothetical protein PVJ39_04640 [Gammaproteobacteria bacterium]
MREKIYHLLLESASFVSNYDRESDGEPIMYIADFVDRLNSAAEALQSSEEPAEHTVDDLVSLKTAMTKLGVANEHESNEWTHGMFLSGVRRVLRRIRDGLYDDFGRHQFPSDEEIEAAMDKWWIEPKEHGRSPETAWKACAHWLRERMTGRKVS